MKNDVRLFIAIVALSYVFMFIAIVALSYVVTFSIIAAKPDRPMWHTVVAAGLSAVGAAIAAHHLSRLRKG